MAALPSPAQKIKTPIAVLITTALKQGTSSESSKIVCNKWVIQ
jgi:hypothetical protein